MSRYYGNDTALEGEHEHKPMLFQRMLNLHHASVANEMVGMFQCFLEVLNKSAPYIIHMQKQIKSVLYNVSVFILHLQPLCPIIL